MRAIEAEAARELIHGGVEVAFLDVREAGEFGEGHPLFAVPLPYSRLEARMGRMVPRRDVSIVLIDGGDGIAERAASRLPALGYGDVAVVEGGVPSWASAGYALYKGVNVPSKTLGELAEALWHPETVRAEELAAWRARGDGFALFDARPPEEYVKMRVPGARCLPNGELAHRLAVAAGKQPLVVTCAGRTRGIVGAIGLRLAGHAGPIFALENGTQGWALARMPLERGNEAEPYPELDEAALARSREMAAAIREKHGIAQADAAQVAAMLREPRRTTYLFDLRSEAEAAADPLPAAVQAPGGQLVQATDQWVGVRRARIVLADEGGLRSALAAFWLKQLGYEPIVARIGDAVRALPARDVPKPQRVTGRMDARAALSAVTAGALLVDLRGSMAYRREHVAGAVWTIRPRLAALGPLHERAVVAISESREIADMAALDLAVLGAGRVDWVEGGHEALVAAGARTKIARGRPADRDAIDHLFFVHDRHDGNLDASRRYLEWETELVGQLDQDERAEFRLIGPS
jgi:rhodanese-related sulfurtransferase